MRAGECEDGAIGEVGRGDDQLPHDDTGNNKYGLACTLAVTAKYHAVLLTGRSGIELFGGDQEGVWPGIRDIVGWRYPRGKRRTGCDLTGARAVHQYRLGSDDDSGVSRR